LSKDLRLIPTSSTLSWDTSKVDKNKELMFYVEVKDGVTKVTLLNLPFFSNVTDDMKIAREEIFGPVM